LQLLHEKLGNEKLAAKHQALHLRYKPDDNAQGRAIRLAREKYPAANHAAEAVVKYPLDRDLPTSTKPTQTSVEATEKELVNVQ